MGGRTAAAALVSALAASLAVAGCGERVPAIGDPGPATAPPRQSSGPGATSEDPALVARLRRLRPASAPPGAVVVVDVTGRDLTGSPKTIQFSKDGTLSRLRWTGWGSPAAVGRGQVLLLECTPSCARGFNHASIAEIRLTHLRRCSGRRFYDAAEVSFGAGARRNYARAFIGAPC